MMIEQRIIRNIHVWDSKMGQFVRIDLDVNFDINALAAELGQKAYDNKAGKSYLKGGFIEVKRRGTKADPVMDTIMAGA